MIESRNTPFQPRPMILLALGILFVVAAHVSYSIDIVAWFSSVPFLLYLHQTKGMKSRLLLAAALFVAWTLATAKIITPPIPFAMVFLFSLPLSLIHLPAFLIWDRFKARKHALFVFPLVFTLMEWIQYTFMPFASWGVAANTQSHGIVVMQSLSLFGMAGLSFLIHWVNIALAEVILNQRAAFGTAKAAGIVLVAILAYGSLRLDIEHAIGDETIKVAAVGTDSEVSGPPFPAQEVNAQFKHTLVERTVSAAQKGAKLVVWNEAAVFIPEKEEADWQDSLKAIAKRHRISLVAAYVVPRSVDPLRLENKFVSIRSTGELDYLYHKHQPVPGEPSIKGDEPFKAMQDQGIRIGGAICYDIDYPYIARALGKQDVNIVAIPSSDWRGIDPLHTRMAAYRAIEQGYSLLRSTRFGLSAAINPLGEFTAQQSSFDGTDKIMLAELPTKRLTTLYSIIGDAFVYACLGALTLLLLSFFRGQPQTGTGGNPQNASPNVR